MLARSVALCLLTCLLAFAAQAQPSRRPALHWVRLGGAESCIDPRSLAQRVEGITGSVFVDAAHADLSIEARIATGTDGTYSVHVKLAGAPEPRVAAFSTHDCRSLDNAIAFLIAMTIDPDLATSPFVGVDWMRPDADPAVDAEQLRSELATQPAQKLPATANPMPPASATRPPRVAPQRPLLPLQLSAAVGGGYGLTGSPTVGFAASGVLDLTDLFALGAQLQAAAATSAFEVDDARSVLTQNVGLSVFACATLFDPRVLALHACAGPELSLLIATGQGFMDDATTALWSGGAVARLQLQHQLSQRWSVLFAALGSLDVGQPSVYYRRETGVVNVLVPDRFSFQFLLGAAYAF